MVNVHPLLRAIVRPDARPTKMASSRALRYLEREEKRDHDIGFAIEVVSDLSKLESEWREFERTAEMTPFQTFDWLSAWQTNIGSRLEIQPCIVVGRDHNGRLAFVLPLAVRRFFTWKTLTWLASETSDYNAPLLNPEFVSSQPPSWLRDIWPSICQRIQARRQLRFHFVDLRKMPQRVGRFLNPFLELPVKPNASKAHSAELTSSWEQFYGKRSSTTRRRDRTKLRRLAEYGEVRHVETTGTGEALGTVTALVRQKSAQMSRMGAVNIFESEGFFEFLKQLAETSNLRPLVHISELKVGDAIAAANVGLIFRSTYYLIFMSYDPGEMSRFGPGAHHLREVMRSAIEKGVEVFDFTIGDESYKREWSNRELLLFDHVAAAKLIGVPPTLGLRLLMVIKHRIKNTEFLWRNYLKVRSLLAAARLKIARHTAYDGK